MLFFSFHSDTYSYIILNHYISVIHNNKKPKEKMTKNHANLLHDRQTLKKKNDFSMDIPTFVFILSSLLCHLFGYHLFHIHSFIVALPYFISNSFCSYLILLFVSFPSSSSCFTSFLCLHANLHNSCKAPVLLPLLSCLQKHYCAVVYVTVLSSIYPPI